MACMFSPNDSDLLRPSYARLAWYQLDIPAAATLRPALRLEAVVYIVVSLLYLYFLKYMSVPSSS